MSKRIFTALSLPPQICQSLMELYTALPEARWIEPDDMHLTLRFIGEVDGSMFKKIREALKAIRFGSFALEIEGVGYFPPRAEPRVLFAGIKSSPTMHLLKAKIDRQLFNCGIGPDARKYHPHITLARLKRTPEASIAQWLSSNALLKLPPFKIENFGLISSQLTNSGAIYKQESLYMASAELKILDNG